MANPSSPIPSPFNTSNLLVSHYAPVPVTDDQHIKPVVQGFGSPEKMNHDYFSPTSSPSLDFGVASAARTNSVFYSTASQLQPLPNQTLQATPEKVRTLKRVFSEHDFEIGGEPFGTSKKQIVDGITALKDETTDALVKRQRSTQSRIVHCLFNDEVVGRDPETDPVSFHAKTYEMAEFSPTLKRLVGALVYADRTAQHKALSLPISQEIINIKHLIEADRRGFHLCLFSDPMFMQLSHHRYSTNSVYQATFPVDPSGKLKSSTFFPLYGVDELVHVIHSAQPMATIGNRSLCFVPDQPYLIEMYKSGAVIKSAFPIFFFTEWDADSIGHPIVRGKPLVSSQELLDKARSALLEYSKPNLNPNPWNPVRYTINSNKGESSLIIDLAPSFPELGISQGIFIQFSRSLFEDLIDSDVLDEICLKA